MFKIAISKSLKYIRPLATGYLYFKDFKLTNGLSTLIVLNKNGDILTTAATADLFKLQEETNEVYPPILKEIYSANERKRSKIIKKYGILDNTLIDVHNILIDIADNPGRIQIIKHDYLDLAIIRIENKKNLLVKDYPIFKDNTALGTSICKVGFAFAEYNAFNFNKDTMRINNDNKYMNFPIFPLDGMIARNIIDDHNNISLFETTTALLPGHIGSPVLDKDGYVLGMLVGMRKYKSPEVSIDLAYAINSKTIMQFLNDNNIEYEVK